MANSKQRRQMRRLVREELVQQAKKPVVGEKHPLLPTSSLTGIAKKVFGGLLAAATLLGLLGLYVFFPRFEINKDFDFDAKNPYTSSFYIENNGYLPATDVSGTCTSDTSFNAGKAHFNLKNVTQGLRIFAASIPYKGRATIPCIPVISPPDSEGFALGSKYRLVITYRIYAIPIIHRNQHFDFSLVRDKDGKYHWIYR